VAKYKVLEKSFINGALVEEGEIIDYDGEPGPNLEPVSKKRNTVQTAKTNVPEDGKPEGGQDDENPEGGEGGEGGEQ
jgi:hypothetical protein